MHIGAVLNTSVHNGAPRRKTHNPLVLGSNPSGPTILANGGEARFGIGRCPGQGERAALVRRHGFPVWVCECRPVRLRTRLGARKRADLLRNDLRVRTGKPWVGRPAVASRLDAWRAAT